MISTEDYYSILRIASGAPAADITASYRRLCKIYHGDINPDPEAEELMKQINLAYHTLKDERRRREYDASRFPRTRAQQARASEDAVRARLCVEGYFDALLKNKYDEAYVYLSMYDKRHVTARSFRDWRQSVGKLFSMRGYTVGGGDGDRNLNLTLDGGHSVEARLFSITITERNAVERTTDRYSVSKYAVKESGDWRIFLGYRDLNDAARSFKDMNEARERSAMEKHWAEYCRETNRELDMPSLEGLLKRAETELYRHTRYKQSLAVACFAVAPDHDEVLEVCARVITETVRASDHAAYIGSGVFVTLYTGIKKKYAGVTTRRLAAAIRAAAEKECGVNVAAAHAHEWYEGGGAARIIDRVSSAARGALRGQI